MSVGEVRTIGELATQGVLEFGDGYRTKRSEHGASGYRIIRVADVDRGVIHIDGPDFVSDQFSRSIGGKAGQTGDVLLTTKGTVGRVAIVRELSEPIVYSPQLCYFRVRDGSVIDPTFLSLWFKSDEFFHQASHRMNNTDMAAYINLADIRSLALTLPDISEQRAIAEVLDALDNKIAANLNSAETADHLAGFIYDRAARGRETIALSSVVNPILGGTPSRSIPEYWVGTRPWASAKDITSSPRGVLLETEEHLSATAVSETKAKSLPVGSVILTARGTVGKVSRLAVAASFNQSCYGFVPGELPAAVLYFTVLRATAQAKAHAHGSVFDTITMSTFDHLATPLFSAGESAQLESELSPLLDLVTGVLKENQMLAKTRDTLLPELLSGKLQVRDAEKALEAVL